MGVVEAVGAGVKGLERGDHVLVAGLGAGTWSAKGTFHERNVFVLNKKTPFETAATLSSVCTAVLLSNSVQLKAGDVVVHAGSPGSVGLALAQLAASSKVKLVSILRNGPGVRGNWWFFFNVWVSNRRPWFEQVEQSVSLLKEHGAFAAVTEDYARSAAFRRLLSDLPKPRLVLNGLGGRAATDAARLLDEKGTLISYAGKTFQIPPSLLIERGITVTGFSLQRVLQTLSKESMQSIVSNAEKLNLKLLIEKFPLSKFPAALARHEQPFRNRKIVLLNQQ